MAICERQELDSKLIGKLEHAIFYQRPLKSQKGLVGHCVFEPKKTKCPVSHPLFEEFRMLSFINSIKIQTPSDTVMRPLNDEERSKIKPLFYRKSKRNFDFADIAKKLAGKNKYAYYKGGNAPYLFNYFKDSNVSGCPVNASLRDLFGEDWLNNVKEVYDRVEGKTDLQIINDIWSALFFYTDNDKLAELIGLGGPLDINNIELGNMAFADNGNGSSMFTVVHSPCRLDTNNVVLTLITDNVIRRNIYQLDIFRHDNMGSHLLVDINNIALIVVEDVISIRIDTLDIMNLSSIDADLFVFLGLG